MGSLKVIALVCIGGIGFISTFVSVLQLAEFLSSQKLPDDKTSNEPNGLMLQLRNVCLLGLFALQHSGMCSEWWRSWFKGTSISSIERSVFVIATGAAIQLIVKNWTPLFSYPLFILPIHKESGMLWTFFFLLHSTLWLIIYTACLTMDMAELIGIKQIYYEILGLSPPVTLKSLETRRLYKHMRHPGAISFVLILWLHPIITVDRLIMAYLATMYVWFGFKVDDDDYVYVDQQADRKLSSLKIRGGGA